MKAYCSNWAPAMSLGQALCKSLVLPSFSGYSIQVNISVPQMMVNHGKQSFMKGDSSLQDEVAVPAT
ncbi:hypothetical protein E2C01_005359 [Portunus trituberculatus]|uniref:Uncharacterized protein n=1 Tax=Portunus trituberculatus TaxID=210409 RepID=A0A5B7CWG9_PORTR|nr:hypothetical protein [Portunus trituberculatus]